MSRLRLKYRIAVTIFLLEMVMVLCLLWVTLSYSLSTSRAHLDEMHQLIFNLTADLSRTALLTQEFVDLQAEVENVIRLSNASHVVLSDERGRIVSSNIPSEIGSFLSSFSEQENHFWISEDVLSLSGKIGRLSVEFSNEAVAQAFYNARNHAIAVAVAGMGIIALAGMIMGRVLTRRLDILKNTARQITEGRFETRFDLKGSDEVAEVGQAFNVMAEEIGRRIHAVKEKEAQFRTLVGNLPAVVYRMAHDQQVWRVQYVSSSSRRLSGYPAEGFMNQSLDYMTLIYSEDQARVRQAILDSIQEGRPYSIEYRFHHQNGTVLWVSDLGQCILDEQGRPLFLDGVVFDITARKQHEEETRKLSSAIEQTGDAIMITDPDGTIEYLNPAVEHLSGYSKAELLGKNVSLIKSGKHDKAFFENLWKTLQAGQAFQDVLINRKKDGSLFYEEMVITPLEDNAGNITHYISTGRDISERIKTQERLYHLAYHDLLTKLPNRAFFMERLNHAMQGVHSKDTLLGILFMDLDRFKNINDSLGHDVGDKLLQAFSIRIRKCLREVDTVARLSGDEFVVLLEGMTSREDAVMICRKILEATAQAFLIEGRELFITTSIGISLYPQDGRDGFTLMKNADIAMYRAKELGRNDYQFYDAEMSVMSASQLNLETQLRGALERGEFALYYQPQVSGGYHQITGVEALLRWHHPEMGMIYPKEFVPMLEETGLIIPVGEWVLKTAVMQARAWQLAGIVPARVAVNLSSRQINGSRLVEKIFSLLKSSKLDPGILELEMTESLLMENKPLTLGILKKLSGAGIRLSIDDFGTGYSSLAYLKRFPIDTLKIDGSFIRDITTNQDDAAIVQAIIALATSLKMEVVAEGVETREQLRFLEDQHCQKIQGFFFNPPLSTEAMTALLEKSRAV